jgi:hypothetical protein
VSRTVLTPSVLWRNQQTVVHLVLRPKSRNHRGDFDAKNKKTEATDFEAKSGKTVVTGFEAKPVETVLVVFRPNH